MEAQAQSLGLPLLRVEISKDASYKEAYVAGLRKLWEEHGIRVIVTGDMDLVGGMKRNWMEECGEEAGMRVHLPLWQADRATCLRKLLAERFRLVFSCVKSPWFDCTWIGRTIDEDVVSELERMALAAPYSLTAGTKPLDIGGECGEYHTMCLDGPLYASRVPMKLGEPCELGGQDGQKDGERWWCMAQLE